MRVRQFVGKRSFVPMLAAVLLVLLAGVLLTSSKAISQYSPFIVEDFDGSLTLENHYYNSPSTSLTGFSFPWNWVYAMSAITDEASFPPGGRSIKADYNGVTEGSAVVMQEGLNTSFGVQSELYVRFYIRLNPNFKFPLNQKILLLEGSGWYFNHQIQGYGTNNNHYTIIGSEGNRTGWQVYTGNIYTPGKWFYVEYRFKRNSPGASDGVVQRWWRNVTDNGPLTQDINETSVNLTGNNGNAITTVRFLGTFSDPGGTGGNSNSVIHIDSLAVGMSRIGEVGATSGGAYNAPPAPPTNLRIL